MNKRFPSLCLVVFLFGCASDPIVDRRGVDENKYQRDLAECRGYGTQVNTPGETAKHAAVGAAIGGTIGAIAGDITDAGQGAGIGVTIGATKGFNRAEHRKEKVVYRCLKGRGYRVLG